MRMKNVQGRNLRSAKGPSKERWRRRGARGPAPLGSPAGARRPPRAGIPSARRGGRNRAIQLVDELWSCPNASPRCVAGSREISGFLQLTLDAPTFPSLRAVPELAKMRCGGPGRMLVAFGNSSRSSTSPIKGHVRAPAVRTLARCRQRKHELTVVCRLPSPNRSSSVRMAPRHDFARREGRGDDAARCRNHRASPPASQSGSI